MIGWQSSLTRILSKEARWQECQWNARQRATSLSDSSGEPEASSLPIPSYVEMHLRLGDKGSWWRNIVPLSRPEETQRWVQRPRCATKDQSIWHGMMMGSIKKYLRSHCGVIKAPLAYIISPDLRWISHICNSWQWDDHQNVTHAFR